MSYSINCPVSDVWQAVWPELNSLNNRLSELDLFPHQITRSLRGACQFHGGKRCRLHKARA